jgi:outer membrane receptor protein involved in Fe transport
LSLTAALRWDGIHHDVVDRSPEDPGKATGEVAFGRWVPAAGLAWAFAPQWRASAAWAHGFRAPAFLELTCADPAAPCIGLQSGVAPDTSLGGLRPVRARSLQAGLAFLPGAGVTVALDLFRIDLADDIYSVAAPGTARVFFRNVGDTRREGFELSARKERGRVEGEAVWAYTRATFESDLALATPRLDAGEQQVRRGAELPLTPRHRVALGARLRAASWLRLSAGLTLVGPQRFLGDEANVAPPLAAYAVARAGAEVGWRGWTAFVRAANLLDGRHEVFGTFSRNGRLPGQPIEPFLTPGPPLRLTVGLRWELE